MARLRYLQNKRSGAHGTISKSTEKIYFYDEGLYIGATADGTLALISDTTLNIEGTTALNLTGTTITLTGAITMNGDITLTGDDLLAITVTDPTTACNAIYGYIDAGGAWTSGNMVGLRGKVAVSGTVNYVSATGVWAGLDFATSTGSGSGLTCALNAEVSSNNSTKPNAIIYIQSLPATNADFATVPYIAFTETGAGTGSNILFSLGHTPAGTGSYVTTGSSGNILYHQTIHITANGSDAYIPYSTVEGSFTTAYPIVNSNVTGYRANPTFVPDQYRTNYAFAVGFREVANELDVTMAASTNQNFDPFQMNINVIGANPSGTSTTNLMYSLITHDTTDMSNLRLKCSDWNVVIAKDVKDAYVYQGEIDFTAASIGVGGESAVLGLVMNAGSSAVTGNLRGIIISMQGTGMPADALGIELRSTATTLAEGIRISGTPLITVGIAMGNQANDNEGPTHAFFFPSPPGADIGPCVNTVDDGNGEGSIKIKIGSSTKYLKYWADAAA